MSEERKLAEALFGVIVGFLRAQGVPRDEIHAHADEAMRGAEAVMDGDATGWSEFASRVEETIAAQLQRGASEPGELAAEPAERRGPPFGGKPAVGRAPRPAVGRSPRESPPK